MDFLPVGWADIVVPRFIDRWDYAHRMRNVRLAGLFAGLGYLGVLAGTIAWIVAFHAIDESLVFELTTTAGYGLAGWACWRWITTCRNNDTEPESIRGPSRWMAVASVVTAAGFAAVTHEYYESHQFFAVRHLASVPHYRLQITGGLACVVGFLLAGIGFWVASIRLRAPIPPLEAVQPAD